MYKYEEADEEEVKKLIDDWESEHNKTHKYLEDERAEFEIRGKKWSVYGSPVRVYSTR